MCFIRNGSDGSASSFNTVTSAGGGKGVYNTSRPLGVGSNGGSGGGATIRNRYTCFTNRGGSGNRCLQIHHKVQMVVIFNGTGSSPNADAAGGGGAISAGTNGAWWWTLWHQRRRCRFTISIWYFR